MQSAYFSYDMPFTRYQTDGEINQLLDSAAAHNIKIILPDLVSKIFSYRAFLP